MTQVGKDSLATRSTLTVGGKKFAYYSLAKAAEKIGDVSRLPFSMKVLLENLLRFEDAGFTVSVGHIQALAEEAGLDRPEEFARSWHILMKGSIISATEGDTLASKRAQQMARWLIEHHRGL